MPPSSGHILVPGAIRAVKFMVSRGAAYIKARLPAGLSATKPAGSIPIRIARQPIHPLAALRQTRNQQRNFSTAFRRILQNAQTPISSARPAVGATIRSAIGKSNYAPFSSPLRPNLTGGALPRSSGGYSLGGNGARYFSSTPAAQAHVFQNVSAAVRAFCINGFKVQYDGQDHRSGAKKFRALTAIQDKTLKSMSERPYGKGTTLEFRIAPTITAVPAVDMVETTLESEGVVTKLASDFARSLSSLALVHGDLKKLATLGALPISYPNPHTLCVRFAGCDARIVHALCDELGIQRGIVREDAEWDEEDGDKEVEMALLFPWAPSQAPSEDMFYPVASNQALDWQDMITKSPIQSIQESSDDEFSAIHTPLEDSFSNPWQSGNHSTDFDALQESDIESNEELAFDPDLTRTNTARPDFSAYEGMEGMLRFFEQCETRR